MGWFKIYHFVDASSAIQGISLLSSLKVDVIITGIDGKFELLELPEFRVFFVLKHHDVTNISKKLRAIAKKKIKKFEIF